MWIGVGLHERDDLRLDPVNSEYVGIGPIGTRLEIYMLKDHHLFASAKRYGFHSLA